MSTCNNENFKCAHKVIIANIIIHLVTLLYSESLLHHLLFFLTILSTHIVKLVDNRLIERIKLKYGQNGNNHQKK